MSAREPTLEQLAQPLPRYFLATRPAFLTVTLGACFIGLASAALDGITIDWTKAIVTLVFGMAAHAGANVLNDYYDSRSGNDASNQERIFPFTGGSRFIQNGVLTERQTLRLGSALVAATMAAGLWLMAVSGPGLFFFGLAGLFLGIAYSAPPLALNSRGLGEACIWLSWMIVAGGADYVQRAGASPLPWMAAAGYALLVTNVLFINQFPDRRADQAAGKRHWVVRLGPDVAAETYLVIALAAHALLALAVAARGLPLWALLGLGSLPLSLKAGAELRRHRHAVSRLAPAIQMTIAAALLHAALLSLGLVLAR